MDPALVCEYSPAYIKFLRALNSRTLPRDAVESEQHEHVLGAAVADSAVPMDVADSPAKRAAAAVTSDVGKDAGDSGSAVGQAAEAAAQAGATSRGPAAGERPAKMAKVLQALATQLYGSTLLR